MLVCTLQTRDVSPRKDDDVRSQPPKNKGGKCADECIIRMDQCSASPCRAALAKLLVTVNLRLSVCLDYNDSRVPER